MDSDRPDTTGGWWDSPVPVTCGQIVLGVATWCVLDLIAAIVRHL